MFYCYRDGNIYHNIRASKSIKLYEMEEPETKEKHNLPTRPSIRKNKRVLF